MSEKTIDTKGEGFAGIMEMVTDAVRRWPRARIQIFAPLRETTKPTDTWVSHEPGGVSLIVIARGDLPEMVRGGYFFPAVPTATLRELRLLEEEVQEEEVETDVSAE